MTCNSDIIPYADDSVLLCVEQNIEKLKIKTEASFRKIECWINCNRLTINYKKTNCVLFSHNKHKVDDQFSINTNSSPISATEVIKYLGVFIDKLTWKNHIHSVIEKLCIAKGVLSKLRHYVPVYILRNVYFGIVSSHLQYGITAWGNAAAKFIDKLQIQQNYIIKIMTGSSFFRTKLFPIYCELNLLKLSNIYILEVLKFVYKFRARLLPSSFADYFHSAPEIHNMPTRFSKSNNLALPTFYTSGAQRSIRYQGYKI